MLIPRRRSILRAIDAILFDADGVIQRPPPDLAAQLATAFAVDPRSADEFILDLFRAEAEALTGHHDIQACVEPVLARWSVKVGFESFSGIWHQIEVDHSALELVADLRATGIYCALASNQQSRRATAMSVELGYEQIFDAEFYSCDLGAMKPDPGYFYEVIERSGCKASRTLFIDDRAANVEAAKGVGLHVLQFAPEWSSNGGVALRRLIAPFIEHDGDHEII
jgi:putative hydrolase of the HAD superfamily